MPIPKPNLDDRHFQDIVDEAKRLIPRYCPEWTDHNVSDPGVALIELFAWMTDMLLYRVNQVPEKVYLTLLEMIGIQLEAPRSARAPVTFYLSAPQRNEIVIPSDTEVSTIRTETAESIIFTTERDLTIRPVQVMGVFTRAGQLRAGVAGWVAHDLRQLDTPNGQITMFPRQPVVGDMFYIALESDHSNHVLALVIDCEEARGAGIDPNNPPITWEVWSGGMLRWAACVVEFDGTGGFNQPGEIILRLPEMVRQVHQGVEAFWLRCRLNDLQGSGRGYELSPDLLGFAIEARGGTVGARHAVTISNEYVGRSEGTPGQVFQLINTPVLERDPQRDYLEVDPPLPGQPLRWQEVSDFSVSGPHDQHYTLDNITGTLTLGPALLQPNGQVLSFGAVPPRGSTLKFTRYQYGGGVLGNVPRHAINVLKTSIPYVARVTNWEPASGGRDAETLENAKLRAPQHLRTRTRAMTTEDYEFLAGEVKGVARACCIGPGAQPGSPSDPRPGQVFVHILPQTDSPRGRISPEMVSLSADLRSAVFNYLDARRPLGTILDVQPVQQYWVAVEVRLRLPDRRDPAMALTVQQQAEAALYEFLNPYVGGPQGRGWPFGRDLHISELYGVLQRINSVEFVEEVKLFVVEPGGVQRREVGPRLEISRQGVVVSHVHTVAVV
jgi:predicted phage baseplate assembly protein